MNFLIYPKEGDHMSGNGKAGNGNGNNRRRPGKRRDNRQKGNSSYGNEASPTNGNPRNFAGETQKARGRTASGGEPRPYTEGNRGNRSRSQASSENQGRQNRNSFSKRGGELYRREKPPFFERPKWIPPKINTEPLPTPDCPWCGKPIRDISLAIADKDTEAPVHFECVSARISGGEILEKGDVVTYIGGGRFGIVCFNSSGNSRPASRDFKIKKIIEWENKDKRADWRSLISDRYSIT